MGESREQQGGRPGAPPTPRPKYLLAADAAGRLEAAGVPITYLALAGQLGWTADQARSAVHRATAKGRWRWAVARGTGRGPDPGRPPDRPPPPDPGDEPPPEEVAAIERRIVEVRAEKEAAARASGAQGHHRRPIRVHADPKITLPEPWSWT